MNLFDRRARIVELQSGSSALATGLYVGSYAGLASGGWGDDGSTTADGGDQPVSVDHDDGGQLATEWSGGERERRLTFTPFRGMRITATDSPGSSRSRA